MKTTIKCILFMYLSMVSVSMYPETLEAATLNVSTASQLTNALNTVKPGDTIVLAAGTYSGKFSTTIDGGSSAWITLKGPSSGSPAILNCGSTSSGYGLYLNTANFWSVKYLTIKNCAKGIVLDESDHVTLDHLTVQQIGQEGIHLRTFSSANTIQYSTVKDTGLTSPGTGEGIYVGSSQSNWSTYTNGEPDRSDDNRILYNKLGPNVRAEGIDVKEGTTGTQIIGNTFDSTGISGENYADSFVDIKGNGCTVTDNIGSNSSTRLIDGMQVHVQLSGWGNNNLFRRNKLTVNASGYGFNIQSGASGNKVYSDNTASGAKKGLTNISITSARMERVLWALLPEPLRESPWLLSALPTLQVWKDWMED